MSSTLLFQSTRPRGARPTWPWDAKWWKPKFQSTRPRGARRMEGGRVVAYEQFQSTRPRGARRLPVLPAGDSVSCFNPRARAGRDGSRSFLRAIRFLVSIHAPARGATRTSISPSAPAPWFQSTRPRGARPFQDPEPMDGRYVSIHAPARGATHRLDNPCAWLPVSIHAPARGATG